MTFINGGEGKIILIVTFHNGVSAAVMVSIATASLAVLVESAESIPAEQYLDVCLMI